MKSPSSFGRRHFLTASTATVGTVLGDFAFLKGLPRVSAEQARLDLNVVQLGGEMEPIVRFLESTPRDRLLEETGARIQSGKLSYQQILAALQLAGVRNVQPRPVGFKFHSVLVVNSAHLASINSPAADRWLPIFWALDYYKRAEAEDVQQNDWTMAPVDEAALPKPHRAAKAFRKAMDNWDVEAADAAIAALVRSASAGEVFELFANYGSRDFRDIGHKAIFVANSFRLLQQIGWRHAEPILRCMAYALLDHEEGNPAERDARPDRPWRLNQELVKEIPQNWRSGEKKPEHVPEMLQFLREASFEEGSRAALASLKAGVSPDTLWDAFFQFSGELLMRTPGIVSLHAVTSINAMHYAYQACSRDQTRRRLLLQAAAFLTMFRQNPVDPDGPPKHVHALPEGELPEDPSAALETIFTEITDDRYRTAQKVLTFCRRDPDNAKIFIDQARRLLYLKGTNAHDYKFTSAVLEDYYRISPRLRDAYLATSVYNLRGLKEGDNDLVQRSRAALA